MVMMAEEVVQAILNLLHLPLMLATHMVHMMVTIIVCVVIEVMGGILRDKDLICNLAANLKTQPSLRC